MGLAETPDEERAPEAEPAPQRARAAARVKGAAVGAVRQTRSFGFGFACVLRGIAKMAVTPAWWPYAIMPVLLAFIVFVAMAWWAIVTGFDSVYGQIDEWFGHWGDWMAWVAAIATVLVLVVAFLLIFYVGFSAFARLVSAPFLALFTDKVVRTIAGVAPPQWDEPKPVRWVLRPILEAAVVVTFRVAITLLALPLNLIPIAGQIAFAMVLFPLEAMDMLDLVQSARAVPVGNRIPFVWRHRAASMGYGAAAALFLIIPIVNAFVMPALVVGAALLDQGLAEDYPQKEPEPPEPSEEPA